MATRQWNLGCEINSGQINQASKQAREFFLVFHLKVWEENFSQNIPGELALYYSIIQAIVRTSPRTEESWGAAGFTFVIIYTV